MTCYGQINYERRAGFSIFFCVIMESLAPRQGFRTSLLFNPRLHNAYSEASFGGRGAGGAVAPPKGEEKKKKKEEKKRKKSEKREKERREL